MSRNESTFQGRLLLYRAAADLRAAGEDLTEMDDITRRRLSRMERHVIHVADGMCVRLGIVQDLKP